MTERVAGLDDRPRPGRPHTVPRPKIAQVVALTLKGPPRGHTHWTTRDLARRVGVSYGMVHRIWQAHGLQHHRVETFEFTTDPAAAAKIRDIVGFYLDPPANAAVVCVDEKTRFRRSIGPNRCCRCARGYRPAKPTTTSGTG